MNKVAILAVLLAASFGASATNPPNECGNHGNNCQPAGDGGSNANATGGNGYGGSGGNSSSNGYGVGVGVGLGGSAEGGQGGAGGVGVGHGGDGGNASLIGSGNSSANGGDAKAYGGNAAQGQSQSNIGLNSQGQSSRNDNTNISGSKSIAQQALENSNKINASSANDNRSSANGNTTVTNVGGDSTLVERNAPPVFLGNISSNMSCAGGFNAGASDRNGSGAFGFSWISSDCRSVVIGREFLGIGMPDVSCRIWKTTKGYKRAVKADPSLADVDCTAKPAPAHVPVLVAPELAPRIPRG